uniref:Uncharacterized protein n=1 Tax=Panagrolaimus sp. PS1159 TaxID=55785 RepID=A0AC35EX48_9BILA
MIFPHLVTVLEDDERVVEELGFCVVDFGVVEGSKVCNIGVGIVTPGICELHKSVLQQYNIA